jgi:mono/diheme cytochrome c family protein
MKVRQGLWLRLVLLVLLTGSFGTVVADQTGAAPQSAVTPPGFAQLAQATPSLSTLRREGKKLYQRECAICHGDDGEGIAGPPLAGNDFLSNRGSVVAQIMGGDESRGMPPFGESLKNGDIAAIATYVRNAWGNEFGVVPPDYVQLLR